MKTLSRDYCFITASAVCTLYKAHFFLSSTWLSWCVQFPGLCKKLLPSLKQLWVGLCLQIQRQDNTGRTEQSSVASPVSLSSPAVWGVNRGRSGWMEGLSDVYFSALQKLPRNYHMTVLPIQTSFTTANRKRIKLFFHKDLLEKWIYGFPMKDDMCVVDDLDTKRNVVQKWSWNIHLDPLVTSLQENEACELNLVNWTGNSLAAPLSPSQHSRAVQYDSTCRTAAGLTPRYFALAPKSFRSSRNLSKKW